MAYVVGIPWKWPSIAKVTGQSLRKSVAVLSLHMYPLMLSTMPEENISLSKGRTLYQGVLAANTEGLSSTYSWIPEVRYRYNLSAVQGEREHWDFERKRRQTPRIFWIILDKCNRNGTVGKSDKFLAFNTSSADIFKGKNEQHLSFRLMTAK